MMYLDWSYYYSHNILAVVPFSLLLVSVIETKTFSLRFRNVTIKLHYEEFVSVRFTKLSGVRAELWFRARLRKGTNGRLEAVRLLVLAGLPPGGWAVLLTPFNKLSSSGSHCTKWADELHRPAGFEHGSVEETSSNSRMNYLILDILSIWIAVWKSSWIE